MTILLWSLSKSHREPYNAGGHAKRRDTTAGIFFCYSTQVYSVELVAAGSSYKAMLQITPTLTHMKVQEDMATVPIQ